MYSPRKLGLVSSVLCFTTLLQSCDSGITAPQLDGGGEGPPPSAVADLLISPEEFTIGTVGAAIRLDATVLDPSGAPVPGATVTWASLDVEVATVDDDGQVTSRKEGISRITGSAGGKTDTVEVRVSKGATQSIELGPRETVLDAIGDTARITAVALDSKGNPVSASSVKWASLEPDVASVDGGLVTGIAPGVARITGQYTSKADTVTVTVRQAVASVEVTPPAPTVTAGETQQLHAVARDARGNEIPGASFAWAASNASAATVDGSGLVRAVAAGVSYVTATASGKSGTATVTVAPAPVVVAPVASVSVAPASTSVVVGGAALLDVVVKDAAGSVLTGRPVAWSTSNAAVATVSGSGVVTGVAMGNATITATVEGKTGKASVSVSADPAGVASRIVVAPGADTLSALGATAQLGATVYSQAGSAMSGAAVTWSSLDAGVATVDAVGKVTAKAAGTARIVAASGGLSDTATVLVRQVVAAVSVSPSAPSVQTGQTQQLAATAKDANGHVVAGASFTWTSSNTAAATVDASGMVKGVAAGVSYVTASAGGKSAVATVTVSAPAAAAVASVAVSPGTASVAVGGSVDLAAVAKDASGNVLTGRSVGWATSNAGVATVSSTGIVKGVAAGTVTITATVEGKSGTAQVAVSAPISTSALLFQDGFESGTITSSQNGFAWKGGAYVSTSTERVRSGSQAMKFRFGDLGTTLVTEQSRSQLNFTFPAMTEVWLEWYAYYPNGTEGIPGVGAYEHGYDTPDNNKLLRIYADGHYSKAPEWGASTSSEVYGVSGNSKVRIDYFPGDSYDNWFPKRRADMPLLLDLAKDRGRWVQIRFHGRKATPGKSDGQIRMWKDGQLLVNNTGLALYDPTGTHDYFSAGYLYGAANSGFPRATAIYVDDFKIYRGNPGW
ncbi:MAG TPA: Ig-like domain-containing protein [Longimicrobiaceae bacterium]|nr:Ig-like domain-containing protein [Longimicrobiaceae bacterium]